MKRLQTWTTLKLVLGLGTWMLGTASCLRAQEPTVTADPNTNAKDQTVSACARQLNKIYGAIEEYRKKHKADLPAKLSDLMPEYLFKANDLICPFVQSRGGLRTWKKTFNELSPDSYTSYSYEFSPAELAFNQWRGLPKKTWREFKQRAAEIVGPVVPIVRCLDHQRALNLALNGEIYESEIYWEKKFTQDEDLLTVARLFSMGPPPPLQRTDFPPRDPRLDIRQLDLTDYYNATLTNSWQGFVGNDLANLPSGLQEFNGIRFDVRGVIQLRGTELPVEFPGQVDGIKVGQACRRIHFLHAFSFEYGPGVIKGFYRIIYADGCLEEFPLAYGLEVADWWRDPETLTTPPSAQLAWQGENDASKAYGMVVCLYQSSWENPRPEAEIATISFSDGNQRYSAGPFVVAITLE